MYVCMYIYIIKSHITTWPFYQYRYHLISI
jgi:hypothetical protein